MLVVFGCSLSSRAHPLLPLGDHPLDPLVLHAGDALLGEVFFYLGLVHPVHRDASPQFDKLVV